MPIVERQFVQIEPNSTEATRTSQPLHAYIAKSAIVVLGDPGSGKTTTFADAASKEPNAMYVSARDFLTLAPSRWRGKTLYIDGLDEQRAKYGDGGTALDHIRSILDQLGCPRFRLSCRAADWYGSSDSESLRKVSADGTVTVLQIKQLTDVQIVEIVRDTIADPHSFIDESKRRGVYELLVNPQTLKMIVSVVSEGGWPETRTQLFERACKILASEFNPEHGRAQNVTINSDEVLHAAGYICTIQLCSGAQGIALSEPNADPAFPFIGDLDDVSELLPIAARRRIFSAVGAERIVPAHRTISEYLAARYLKQRIRNGYPVNRLLALIAGYDGGTLSDLRGLYAWLSSLCVDFSELLIWRDPLGVVLYGDTAVLAPTAKRQVLENLADLAIRNPWFRAENWAGRPFGGLASAEMEPILRDVLGDPAQHPVFVSCVVDAIRYGPSLPALGDLLLAIIQDNSRDEFLRLNALKAFSSAYPSRSGDLVRLLDDIHAGHVADDHRRLRGTLLRNLYPRLISPTQIIDYLVPEDSTFSSEYNEFISTELVGKTEANDLPLLLDAVGKQGKPNTTEDLFYSYWSMIGQLLMKGLAQYGDAVPASRLYTWLGASVDKYGSRRLVNEDHDKAIKEWFTQHPLVIRDLFLHWLGTTPSSELRARCHNFWSRVFNVHPTEGIAEWFLELAQNPAYVQAADFLFEEAIGHERWEASGLDKLLAFVGANPRFRDVLERQLICSVPAWQFEHAEKMLKYKLERAVTKFKNLQTLIALLPEIRKGSHAGALTFLAKIYFGLFADVDQKLTPDERLIAETSPDIAAAALEGFVALLRDQNLPTAENISKARAESRQFGIGYPLLAGVDLICATSSAELMTLPDDILRRALVFNYANVTGQVKKREWPTYLITSRPELAAATLESFWRTQIKYKSAQFLGIYELAHDETMNVIAKRVALPLLRDYPNCPDSILEDLLRAALLHSDHDALLHLIRDVLGTNRKITALHRTLWLSAAVLLSPNEYIDEFHRKVGLNANKASRALRFMFPRWPSSQQWNFRLPLEAVAKFIITFGRHFRPHRPESTMVGFEEAQTIEVLVGHISNDVSPDANKALLSLSKDPKLLPWRERFARGVAVQARLRREAVFHYPKMTDVVRALSGGRPVNAVDLQGLVFAHLSTLKEQLRYGNTDGYKRFWNIGSHSKPTNPLPENDCRDRLLDLIRPMLSAVDVIAEPEGHYAEDKRADIKVLCDGAMNLPIEVKRHYHRDVWTAPSGQLRKLYMQDPGTKGRGIYLVFWFGLDVKRPPKPPSSIAVPTNAEQLEASLRKLVSEEDRVTIDVIVLDCSRRVTERKRKSKKRTKHNKQKTRDS